MRTLTFAGDGERTPTGAAEGRAPCTAGGAGGNVPDGTAAPSSSGMNPFPAVRTRKSLADLINSTEGLAEIKVEEQEEMECEGEDNEVILMERDFSDDSYDEDGMEEVDERILQSDYDDREDGEGERYEKEGDERILQSDNDGGEEGRRRGTRRRVRLSRRWRISRGGGGWRGRE
jgi:hypothetical protein